MEQSRNNDNQKLPTMLKSSVDSLLHKIDMQACCLSGELLTYSQDDVKEILINEILKFKK